LTVNGGSGSGVYDPGTIVGIQASVPSDSKFDEWTGDAATVANVHLPSTTVTIAGNTVLTANCEQTTICGIALPPLLLMMGFGWFRLTRSRRP